MAEAISNFIVKGPSRLSYLTEFRSHSIELLTNKNYKNASINEKFNSEVYRAYKKLSSKNLSATQAKLELNNNWKQYEKLYKALDYVETIQDYKKEINELKINLTNTMIDKAIRLSFNNIIEFLRENEHKIFKSITDFDNIINKNIFYESYRFTLEKNVNNKPLIKYLLNDLYKANPELISDIIVSNELSNKLESAKTLFFAQLEKQDDIIKSLWQQVIQKIMPVDKNILMNNPIYTDNYLIGEEGLEDVI